MKKKKTKSIREFEKMISIDFPMDSFIFFSTQTRLYELFYVMIKVFIYSWLTNKHACHATYTYHSRLKMAKIIGGSRIPNNMYYLVLGKHQIYKYSTYLEILWKKNRYILLFFAYSHFLFAQIRISWNLSMLTTALLLWKENLIQKKRDLS